MEAFTCLLLGDFGLKGLWTCFQVLFSCADIAALWMWAIIRGPPLFGSLFSGLLPSVFQWVLRRGTTYDVLSRGVQCEIVAYKWDGFRIHALKWNFCKEDVPHLHFCNDWCFLICFVLHAITLYSHCQVKEGAIWWLAILRIRNVPFLCRPSLRIRFAKVDYFGIGVLALYFQLVYHDDWYALDFDSTLGYPGEGPRWSMISANIDSFATNASCLHWNADAFMLQEARVADSNLTESQRKAALCNFGLFCSQPLHKLRASNGTFRIPSGGVATCAHKELTQIFEDKMDVSGAWSILRATCRVTATWHQVSASVKLLAFNFYAVANAASERPKFERNSEMLDQIFMVASQFADIPIVIAGDFQMEPGMYPSVQLALDHWGWADPLLQTNDTGEVIRPCTFFQHAASDDEGQSSIDGILMNRTALAALIRIEVLDHRDRQHRPVQATFAWDRIAQVGTIMQRFASLDLTQVTTCNVSDPACPVNTLAEQMWRQHEQDFSNESDPCKRWSIFNHFATQVLLVNGATWEKGPRVRGRLPKFCKTTMATSQEANGSMASPRLQLLQACLRSLRELQVRLGRPCTGTSDYHTLLNTQRRLLRRLKEAQVVPWSVKTLFLHDSHHVAELVLAAITQELKQLKIAAIRKWRQAMRNATTSSIGKVVYQYLKRKGRVVPQNLIEDDSGNIVFDPQTAMDVIADKWDAVFSVNVSHQHEMQILKQVWPYIHDKGRPVALPPITARQLWEQALRRKPEAAAGLDGWRTREVQALPLAAFQPVADLFNDIEAGSSEFPVILTQVRVIILNKDGSDAPLAKRLIALQSIFTLLYTGLRFLQLQSWQQQIMPSQLKGGIKMRQMSEVHMTLQLEIDHAHSFKGHFAALKLDKSKCFDRLMPKLCAAIMLALGLPTGFVRAFLCLYLRMTRFLSFKQWTRAAPISTPNGVVQGCSLSLLCINLHMAIWAWLMEHIEGVDFRAFIDDTYLWSRQPTIEGLVSAVKATELWDSLCGQFLNASKCEVFATTPDLRRALKAPFPEMRLVEVVNLLGAFVQTTKKNVGSFPASKIQAALRDCEAIRALPCDGYKRAQILATKVLPQIAFAPHLNFIPKRALARLQSAVADSLWQDRPKWRSKHLLLCIVYKAHKLDPFLCRAVTTIAESVRFLQYSVYARQQWAQLFEQDQLTAQAWMTQFSQACQILDIEWVHTFEFSVFGSAPVSFLDFSVPDLKCLLKSLAANKCYHTACLMPRKDISTAVGFLDTTMTLSAKKRLAAIPHDGFSFLFFWESAVTGCTLTADRLAAAGLVGQANCRFCTAPKESVSHFAYECDSLPESVRQPSTNFFFGPNFCTLGIVELPLDTIRDKLQVSSISEVPVCQWSAVQERVQHVWTDGSVQLTAYPWLAIASFAVIAADESIISVGRVRHWRLSSYTAELWAIVVAFARAEQPLVIHTDSLTIVKQFLVLLQTETVQVEWTHANWWSFILDQLLHRKELHPSPLQLLWCPAHLLEHVPSQALTDELANKAGSTRQDIILNRLADNCAKQHIAQLASETRSGLHLMEHDVFARQLWLSQLNRMCKKPANSGTPKGQVSPEPVIQYSARQMCPKWPWDISPALFTWQVEIDLNVPFRATSTLTENNFRTFLRFCASLQWRVGDGFACSVFELAVVAFVRGWRFELPHGTICTPQAFASLIRSGFAFCKQKKFVVAPLLLDKRNKSNGKTFPKGAFLGAEAYVENAALDMLARAFAKGAKATPWSWCIPFDNLL